MVGGKGRVVHGQVLPIYVVLLVYLTLNDDVLNAQEGEQATEPHVGKVIPD